VILDEIPLTPNGKIDCKALPVPSQALPSLEASFVAPRTASEQVLAKIWCEVLQLDRTGMRDNFFELGGHSLLATQVLSRVNKTFRVNVPLRVLFEMPTVAALAEALIAHEAKPGQSEKIACILQKIESMTAEERKLKLEGIKREGRPA
jgi:acyl carrier protein